MTYKLREYHNNLNDVRTQILQLINHHATIIQALGEQFDSDQERALFEQTLRRNKGPFNDETIRAIYNQLLQASMDIFSMNQKQKQLVSRKYKEENTVIKVGPLAIGDGQTHIIAGPCSVESEEQMETIAHLLANQGVSLIRGGAFKPRTSPYDFQGLGLHGLQILRRVADKYDLKVVSEIMDPLDMHIAHQYVDIIQIGARNMQNFTLLKAAGTTKIPILLKRGFSATLEELLLAAEYIVSQGNQQVILCERGIRTFEKWTRNTLDISAIPILKQETHLPIMVDISHATGRNDITIPCAKAALAAGADGIMIEVHPQPELAISDAKQQLNIPTFIQFMQELRATNYLKDIMMMS